MLKSILLAQKSTRQSISDEKFLQMAKDAFLKMDFSETNRNCSAILKKPIAEDSLRQEAFLLRAQSFQGMSYEIKRRYADEFRDLINLGEEDCVAVVKKNSHLKSALDDLTQLEMCFDMDYQNAIALAILPTEKHHIIEKRYAISFVFETLYSLKTKIPFGTLLECALEHRKGMTAETQNNFTLALEHFKKSIQLVEENGLSHLKAGEVTVKLLKEAKEEITQQTLIKNALDLVKKSILLNETLFSPYFLLGQLQTITKQYTEACATYLKGMAVFKNNKTDVTFFNFHSANTFMHSLSKRDNPTLDEGKEEKKLDLFPLELTADSIELKSYHNNALVFFTKLTKALEKNDIDAAIDHYYTARFFINSNLDRSLESKLFLETSLAPFSKALLTKALAVEESTPKQAIFYSELGRTILSNEPHENSKFDKITLRCKSKRLPKPKAVKKTSPKLEAKSLKETTPSEPPINLIQEQNPTSAVKPKKPTIKKTSVPSILLKKSEPISSSSTTEIKRREKKKKQKKAKENHRRKNLKTAKIETPKTVAYVPTPILTLSITPQPIKPKEDKELSSCVVPDVIIELCDLAKTCLTKMTAQGMHRVFIVGGYVRNQIKNTSMRTDIDITFGSAHPVDDLKAAFPEEKMEQLGEFFKITFKDGRKVDFWHSSSLSNTHISDLRALKQDARKRDFTINTGYTNLTQHFFDPTNKAYRDISEQRLEVIVKPDAPQESLLTDPIRGLRAILFAQQGYLPSPLLLDALSQKKFLEKMEQIVVSQPLKINVCLHKLFCKSDARQNFNFLRKTGILKQLFPSLETLLINDKIHSEWLQTQFESVEKFSSLNYVYALFIFCIAKSQKQKFNLIKTSNLLFNCNFESVLSHFSLNLNLVNQNYEKYFSPTNASQLSFTLMGQAPATDSSPSAERKIVRFF